MSEYKEILVKKTPRWVKILIAILVIGNIAGWSWGSAQRELASISYQKIEDLRWEVSQLQREIDDREADISLLKDDLRALGYRPVDLTKIGKANRSHAFADIAGDSRFWNMRRDVDKYLDTLLSGGGKISGYDIERAFLTGGKWDAIDLTKSYWGKLKDNGIISVIVVGNLDLHGETFSECNHSWLLVFHRDWDNKKGWVKTEPLATLIFEPTQRYSFVIHIAPEVSLQYTEGYFYTSPFELEAEIKGR